MEVVRLICFLSRVKLYRFITYVTSSLQRMRTWIEFTLSSTEALFIHDISICMFPNYKDLNKIRYLKSDSGIIQK